MTIHKGNISVASLPSKEPAMKNTWWAMVQIHQRTCAGRRW